MGKAHTQSANSPKLATSLEFHHEKEIKRLENTVIDLKENVKEFIGSVYRLLEKIENGEPNSHRTKNSGKPLGTSANYSHWNKKKLKNPTRMRMNQKTKYFSTMQNMKMRKQERKLIRTH